MDDQRKIIDGLNLFNEKAEKLCRLSFVKTMLETKTGVSLSGKAKADGTFEIKSERRGPAEEAVDAFVLTFRFFIQDNEKSSFANLASYYKSSLIETSLVNEFSIIRNKINNFLDNPGDLAFQFNDEMLTRRTIMATFIYGGLSHANEDKKKQYDAWLQILPFKVAIENEFVYILSIILSAIYRIKELNIKALHQLNS